MGLASGAARDCPEEYQGDIKRFHGATVRIYEGPYGDIKHENPYYATTIIPAVRSYSDGVKVGCTFVTTQALEKIQKWHKEFLDDEAGIHQREGQ